MIVEYLIRYCELVFSDKLPAFHPQLAPPARTRRRSRPRSLAVCAPAKLVSLEETRARAPGSPARDGYLEVGELGQGKQRGGGKTGEGISTFGCQLFIMHLC